ncbi:hypothetical protein C4D60_Mb08t03560 [Musa balbisiana]|uniref:Uncharacterized protein n=1 Tax=Musa balbisiana TaxID=52838 RepID=A0A4V6T4M5_MUSBA|nr:hypothetical protein C4D60_Mb08t03560 [Musa balbisiana]
MVDTLVLRGTLRGHTDMVTAIAAPIDNSDMIVSSSRDKSVLIRNLTKDAPAASADGTGVGSYGVPRRRLTGHSHFVQDVVLSSDGQFPLSGSWDGDLRLWDLSTGVTTRRFFGHTKDVLSVAFSVDNRQIVSASRDRTIKLWNTLGETPTRAPFTRSASAPTGTGCAPPPRRVSRSGTSRASPLFRISSLRPLLLRTRCCIADGSTLFTGYTDGTIRFWEIGYYSGLFF